MTITKEDLQQLAELLREPAPVALQPKPKESFGIRLAAAALVIAVVAAVAFASLNFFAPVLVGAPAQAITALPTLPPRPTTPPYQAPPPAAPQEAAPVVAPPAPVIVVTPTYSTGCHDGVSYVDGVATNGDCSGGGYAPELPAATPEPTATIAPATAVPPDAVYLETIRNQAPHCIRCAP